MADEIDAEIERLQERDEAITQMTETIQQLRDQLDASHDPTREGSLANLLARTVTERDELRADLRARKLPEPDEIEQLDAIERIEQARRAAEATIALHMSAALEQITQATEAALDQLRTPSPREHAGTTGDWVEIVVPHPAGKLSMYPIIPPTEGPHTAAYRHAEDAPVHFHKEASPLLVGQDPPPNGFHYDPREEVLTRFHETERHGVTPEQPGHTRWERHGPADEIHRHPAGRGYERL